MATTYEAIATVTVGGGGAATIDFTSIPATYTDLLLKISARTDRAAVNTAMSIVFNSSLTSYSSKYIRGDGSGVSSFTGASSYFNPGQATGNTATANTFSNGELYIPNYTSSNNKSHSSHNTMENNATLSYMTLGVGVWANSAAITSIEIGLRDYSGVNFVQYSTATLYGIKNS